MFGAAFFQSNEMSHFIKVPFTLLKIANYVCELRKTCCRGHWDFRFWLFFSRIGYSVFVPKKLPFFVFLPSLCFTSVMVRRTLMIKATFQTLEVIWYSSCREKRVPSQNKILPLHDISTKMKPITVAVLFALIFALGVNSASVSLSSSQLTLNGNVQIQFNGPEEAIWAGLSNGKNWNHVF